MHRQFRVSDLAEYSAILGDPLVSVMLRRGRAQTVEETRKWIEYFQDHWQDHGFGAWAMIHRASGTLIGHSGLNLISGTGNVEILYAVGSQYWGKGLATESAIAVVEHAFLDPDGPGLNTLQAFSRPQNIASRRVLEKLDFIFQEIVDNRGIPCARYLLQKEQFTRRTPP